MARGSALEMEIRRGKFRKSVFQDTSQVDSDGPPLRTKHTHTQATGVFTTLTDLSLCKLTSSADVSSG